MPRQKLFVGTFFVLALCAVAMMGFASPTVAAQIVAGSVSKQHITGGRGHTTQRLPQSTAPHVISFINRVSDTDCKNRTDFFKLWNNTTIAGGVCFANNGTASGLNIFNVFSITTGNNTGFVVDSNGNQYPFAGGELCQFVEDDISPPIPDVVQVTITGRTC